MPDYNTYFRELTAVGRDKVHFQAIETAYSHMMARRNETLKKLKNIPVMAEELKGIRKTALDKFEENVKRATDEMMDNGINVYSAKTAEDANKLILELVGDEKEILNVKSLTAEEVNMKDFLDEHGIKAWETDVGALIMQVIKWKPAHTTGVSITVNRQKAAEGLSKLAGRELSSDPRVLVSFVREFVRKKVLDVKVGFSGANAIAADAGEVYIVDNEGNARLVTSFPEKHIILAGLEKIMPSWYACMLYTRIISAYATGSARVAYVSTYTKPSVSSDIERRVVAPASGSKEMHVILLDNGRRKMLAESDFRDALTCIRCGACLYFCPLWNVVGEKFGLHPYMGSFGVTWTLFTVGLEAAAPQAYTCSLCGRCKDACPMGIDNPYMIHKVREKLVEKNILPNPLPHLINNIMEHKSPSGKA